MSITPPPPDQPAGDGSDWRASVLQSYRNAEVRSIAEVLASLEPGATSSSKLMLAMRFEDTIFKSASSLADYRKRMTKRLKKLQKNYVPPATKPTGANDTEILMLELRRQYGDALKYIVKNAPAAIADVKEKTGEDRAKQLQQHTDSVVSWAKELGLDEEAPLSVSAAAAKVSQAQLQKLKLHLERRLENIRTYVVKHAEPDLFLQETLERKDKEMQDRASRMLSVNLTKRIEQLQEKTLALSHPVKKTAGPFDAMKTLQESLEKSQATVPPPTRNNSNDVPAALIHLDKMRAASTALAAYFAIPDRQTTAPRNSLAKILDVAKVGATFVKQVSDKLPKPTTDEVTLEDAWIKVLELPSEAPSLDPEGPPEAKKPRLSHYPPIIKSRVLLTPNRKTPSNLIPALKRKRAKLVRPPHGSRGSHLILEFGKAFTMTIYFSPLLVTLRAIPGESAASVTKATGTTSQLGTNGCASWTPLYHGLTDRNDLSVWGVTGGNYESMGRVVEERLRDASMQATSTLRRCFRNHVKDKTMEFEVEILEASALLEFLHIARTTYMPNWQDDED